MRYPLNILAGIVLVATALSNCDRLILDDVPGETHEEVFEIIWTDLDRNYSYFPLKELDWNQVYADFKPGIEQSVSNDELFDLMSEMLDLLMDVHVNLYINRDRFYTYTGSDTYPEFPTNYYPNIIENNYLENLSGFFPYRYSFIEGENIGYLQISSFGETPSYQNDIKQILSLFRDADGLVIDLRSNGGGSDAVSNFIAGLFIDRALPYSRIRWKNGPAHDDFTEWETKTFTPTSDSPFFKPVVMLMNRKCFSSTESFVLAMRQISRVTTIGDTTGGGSGNPIIRELPNGWSYRFSRWQMTTLEGTFFEGTGLAPDQAVWITPADSAAGRDPILERAILHLKNGNP